MGGDERQTLGLNYADLVPVLARAIQEQQQIIEQQRQQLEKQAADDNAMKARIDELSQKLNLLVASIATSKSGQVGSIGSAGVSLSLLTDNNNPIKQTSILD